MIIRFYSHWPIFSHCNCVEQSGDHRILRLIAFALWLYRLFLDQALVLCCSSKIKLIITLGNITDEQCLYLQHPKCLCGFMLHPLVCLLVRLYLTPFCLYFKLKQSAHSVFCSQKALPTETSAPLPLPALSSAEAHGWQRYDKTQKLEKKIPSTARKWLSFLGDLG